MRFSRLACASVLSSFYWGCSNQTDNKSQSESTSSSSTDIPTSETTTGQVSESTSVNTFPTASPSLSPGSTVTPFPTAGPSSNCPGKRIGQYTWGTELWRGGATELSDFFATDAGKEWGCGDLTINIGDFTAPGVIAYEKDLVPFILRYRKTSKNYESVVWLSYGDVVSGDSGLMSQFVDTFFDWANSISADTAKSLGTIGLSFDVEHMSGDGTKEVLLKVQSMKSSTNFESGKLLVQHTIEGNYNPDGTDYVMRYADSALIMLYRNYMTSSTFKPDSNILSRAKYFLQEQCVHCLDDAYATANYKAKVTVMIEASCAPADYCAKISFCAHDGSGEGATYAWNTLQEMQAGMFSSGLVTSAQFARLFNPLTTYAVHDWTWFRCYAPLSDSVTYSQCSKYHAAAATCRDTTGPISNGN